jgi:hypothetical protein
MLPGFFHIKPIFPKDEDFVTDRIKQFDGFE